MFWKNPASSFFQNENYCFPYQRNVGHHTKNIIEKGLDLSNKHFLRPILCEFLLPWRHHLLITKCWISCENSLFHFFNKVAEFRLAFGHWQSGSFQRFRDYPACNFENAIKLQKKYNGVWKITLKKTTPRKMPTSFLFFSFFTSFVCCL